MRITWSRLPLKLAGVFRTAKAIRTDKETLWVKITHDNIVGCGEATPVDTYFQTLESAERTIQAVSRTLPNHPAALLDGFSRLLDGFPDQLATVAAVDAALHDWIGKKQDQPVVRMLGLDPDAAPPTSFTLGITQPEKIPQKIAFASDYPILKIKLGSPHDVRALEIIRQHAPGKTLRVDANRAWSRDQALAMLPILAKHRVEFLEQPLPPDDLDGLRALKGAAVCPIIADESCVRPGDIPKVADCVDGINIKLSKCGGIGEGLKMIRAARALGLKVMLGCMIESSLGIAAAAQLAPLADWLDLDGHLLLAKDPFSGLGGAKGRLTIGRGPGLGVQPSAWFTSESETNR